MIRAMESVLVTNLRRLLEEKKQSPTGLGKKIGKSPAVVNKILDGTTTSPRIDTLRAIAKALGVSTVELTGEEEPANDQASLPPPGFGAALHVRWQAEAGNWREADIDQSEPEAYIVPYIQRRKPVERYLARVGGDSMNRSGVFDGDMVVCVDWISLDEPMQDGQTVLVQQTRAGGHLIETTVKHLRIFADRYELHPNSTNPVHKPIVVPHGDGESDGREVKILGLVEGVYRPIGPGIS